MGPVRDTLPVVGAVSRSTTSRGHGLTALFLVSATLTKLGRGFPRPQLASILLSKLTSHRSHFARYRRHNFLSFAGALEFSRCANGNPSQWPPPNVDLAKHHGRVANNSNTSLRSHGRAVNVCIWTRSVLLENHLRGVVQASAKQKH